MDDHSNAMRIQVEAGFRRIEKQNHEFNKRFRNVREWIRKNTCCDQNGLFILYRMLSIRKQCNIFQILGKLENGSRIACIGMRKIGVNQTLA